MQIVLKCKYDHGSVGFPKGRIDGLPVDERRYEIVNGFVTIAGEDAIVHHDVEELLAVPGGLYRMPTLAEQEAIAQEAQQASIAQEDGSAQGETAEPPAQQDSGKKKANGGGD